MLEVCCGSYEDGMNAYLGGAKRIELNSSIYLGGITPSIDSLKLLKKNTDLEIICMVRPRGCGFNYGKFEFDEIISQTQTFMDNDCDGIAFGILNNNMEIDEVRCKIIIDIVKKYNKQIVFHRAFDLIKDCDNAIETLINLGVNRILTSGCKFSAIEGKENLKYFNEKYGDKIEILPGSGINKNNGKYLMEYVGVNYIHSSCKEYVSDKTTKNDQVGFGYNIYPNEFCYESVSSKIVSELIGTLK